MMDRNLEDIMRSVRLHFRTLGGCQTLCNWSHAPKVEPRISSEVTLLD